MILKKVMSPSEFLTDCLCIRATKLLKRADTICYAVLLDEQEIAFVAIDMPVNRSYLNIAELFVAPNYRRRGYGARIVAEIYLLARQDNFKKVCLEPYSLEIEIAADSLRKWYLSLGFTPDLQNEEMLEMVFNAG